MVGLRQKGASPAPIERYKEAWAYGTGEWFVQNLLPLHAAAGTAGMVEWDSHPLSVTQAGTQAGSATL